MSRERQPQAQAQKKRWLRHRSGSAPASQASLTNPEQRLMVRGATKAYMQSYNQQLAVDGASYVIVTQDVVAERTNHVQLPAMVEQVERNVRRLPELPIADADYWSEQEPMELIGRRCDVLVAPKRVGPLARWMGERLATEEGLRQYFVRQATVEPVIGWIKSVLGYRRFVLRELKKVRGEWSLIGKAVNLCHLHRPVAAAGAVQGAA